MAFSSWSEFLNMGGHAVYVWSSYGVSLMILLVFAGYGKYRSRQLIQRIKKQVK